MEAWFSIFWQSAFKFLIVDFVWLFNLVVKNNKNVREKLKWCQNHFSKLRCFRILLEDYFTQPVLGPLKKKKVVGPLIKKISDAPHIVLLDANTCL